MPISISKTLGRQVLRLRGETGLALIRTFAARGVVSVGSVGLVAVLGRLYGTTGVGVFALAQSLIVAIAIVGRYGMDGAVMRFVGRDLDSPYVYGYLRYASLKALVLSGVGAAILIVTRHLWADLFGAQEFAPVLVGIAIAAPAFTLAFIYSGFMKAVRKPATAMMFQNGGISLVAAGVVIGLQKVALPGAGLVNIGIAYAVAAWLLVAFGAGLCWLWLREHHHVHRQKIVREEIKAFNRSAAAFFANGVSQFMISVVGLWIAGYFLAASEVGQFKAAQQVAMLIGVLLVVIRAIYPPRFAKLSHERNWQALNHAARQTALLGVGLAIIPAAVCLFSPKWVLSVIGHGFSGAALPLTIIVIAQLIDVGSGLPGALLNMSGQESLVRNISWLWNIIGVLLILGLTPLWGITGTAIGWSVSLAMRKLSCVYFAWRKMGIWILPAPNVLNMLGVSANESVCLRVKGAAEPTNKSTTSDHQ